MTEPPFHHAEPVVIRIPFTNWAIVIGVWRATGWTEEDALLNALTGWGFDPFDDVADPDQEEVNQRVREAVSANVDDIDEEWRIISALGAAD